jgi:outer membrane protein assembly factor BamE (lipoprotein component of BamABCDE complex)
MNTANVLATITITALLAFATGYATGTQDNGKFTIHKTRSGMFIVDDTVNTMGKGKAEAKIYEVLELPTNKKSFQNEGEVEFK